MFLDANIALIQPHAFWKDPDKVTFWMSPLEVRVPWEVAKPSTWTTAAGSSAKSLRRTVRRLPSFPFSWRLQFPKVTRYSGIPQIRKNGNSLKSLIHSPPYPPSPSNCSSSLARTRERYFRSLDRQMDVGSRRVTGDGTIFPSTMMKRCILMHLSSKLQNTSAVIRRLSGELLLVF